MYSEIIGESFTFHLRNAAFLEFTGDSDYVNIISPFSRLYLVTEGKGHLILGHDKIRLEAGNLYLIPGYTPCTYYFSEGLGHYYIHFSMDAPNGLSPYSIYAYSNTAAASELDKSLFNRLVQINPDLQLPHHHPNVYQSGLWLNKKVTYTSACHYLETTGIIKQLFSRFLMPCKSQVMTSMLKYNIQPILLHIRNNLGSDICVNELADMACLSKDHFSKVFKSITGMSPCDYIIRKRIERAQFLLLATEMGQKEIIDETGFRSASYFSRVFKKITTYTPEKYRKQRG